jgi:hypothetical protein
MEDVTKEFLEKLYSEQKHLIGRLRAIRHAIVGMGGEISNADFQDLLDLEGEGVQLAKLLVVPSEFNADLPRTQKIAYVLKSLGGSAYVSEIVDRLLEIEPPTEEMSEEKKAIFKRNISLLTSYLYRDGRLRAKKDGKNRYLYKLIE